MIQFNELPDSSRLWTFNAERRLSDEETARLTNELASFVTGWAAHRKDLTAAFEIRHNQFVLVGVDESKLPPSGCSIDGLVHALGGIGASLGIDLVDAPDIAYRDDAGVHAVTRESFASLASGGEVDDATIVFDRTVARVGDLRAGRWELPAREAWHARAFELKSREAA
jgi:hypothetical protein